MCAWLSTKTGFTYRLPTEAEYEYLSGGAFGTRFGWGDDAGQACEFANFYRDPAQSGEPPCADRFTYSAPVGSFPANRFGLFDTTGNLWAVTSDCWNGEAADCERVMRGGSWASPPMPAAGRMPSGAGGVAADYGIRIVREL